MQPGASRFFKTQESQSDFPQFTVPASPVLAAISLLWGRLLILVCFTNPSFALTLNHQL
jgi:hypothetical protein